MVKRAAADTMKMVLFSATAEARRRGDRRLGTDHLLLGLLHEEDSPAARALGVSLGAGRAASDALDLEALAAVGVGVEALGRPQLAAPARRLLPLSSGARAVLKRAIDAAHPRRTGRLDGGHFLMALLSLHRPDPAAELLHALGVDPAAVSDRLTELSRGGVA
jgi:ATP-dependent Clp protease ATP-binding subunit ClpA